MHIETPTPTNAPVVRARRGAILTVTALACAALLSACGSSNSSTTSTSATNLNTTRVALSIEQSVLAERHLHVTVTCPATVPQEKGRTFVCIATGHNAKTPSVVTKTPFKVTIESNKGYVTYKGE